MKILVLPVRAREKEKIQTRLNNTKENESTRNIMVATMMESQIKVPHNQSF